MTRPNDASATSIAPELSRTVVVSAVRPEGQDITITATKDECDALVHRLGASEVTSLSATLRVLPLAAAEGEQTWQVSGRFEATVVQASTVSLEIFSTDIAEDIEANFAALGEDYIEEIDLTVDDESPEPLDNGMIDVGELVVQHLALALDPHPRLPGETFEAEETPETNEPKKEGAFAALKSFRVKG